MDKEEIVKLLLAAKQAYYSTSEPIMSDAEYDRLEDQLRSEDPDNPFFSIVGTDTSAGTKVTHSIPMLSMAKVKNMPDFIKWYQKISDTRPELCVMPKIDGLSGTCRYVNGKLTLIATRGDGSTGQDVSHIIKWMKDIPAKLDNEYTCEIRGELYLPRNTDFDTRGRPLRNNCVGLINRKENREDLVHVRFIAYQLVSITDIPFKTESAKIDYLSKSGFNTVPYKLCPDEDELEDYWNSYLETYRDSWLFETDGLIAAVNDSMLHDEIDSRWVVNHHHHYSIAIKPPADARESILLDIEWNVSRQGNLIPVALFKPVTIGGATLQRASLHNCQFVRDLKLHKGDKLEIERANDVIPYIRQNLAVSDHSDSNLIPEACPFCLGKLEENGVHIRCSNASCDEKNIQRIIFWVKEIGMEQVAEQTIRQLYSNSIVREIKDLYSLTAGKLDGLEGFAEKKTVNLLKTIDENRSLSAGDFIGKLGIPLVQKKALKKLGIYSINDFLRFSDDEYATGKNIIDWKKEPANINLFNELLDILEITDDSPADDSVKTVCLTGAGPAGRKELSAILEEKGFVFGNTVTKETDILVCEDPSSSSSKLQKARKLGIEIVSYKDFFPEYYK